MAPELSDHDAAVFFDFDGTLVDLAPRPDAIHVPDGLPAQLVQLDRALAGALAVVSGRTLADVDHYLAPAKLCVAGEHGASRRGADGHAVHLHVGGLEAATALLQATCAGHPGLLLEVKGGALALHYRQAPELEDLCREAMERALGTTEGMGLLGGKMVIELKPRRASKGQAVADYLAEPPFRRRRPWFFGDDVTDESAFELVQARGGVAVKVGAGDSIAAHRLPDPEAVRRWLARAADELSARSPPAEPR